MSINSDKHWQIQPCSYKRMKSPYGQSRESTNTNIKTIVPRNKKEGF